MRQQNHRINGRQPGDHSAFIAEDATQLTGAECNHHAECDGDTLELKRPGQQAAPSE